MKLSDYSKAKIFKAVDPNSLAVRVGLPWVLLIRGQAPYCEASFVDAVKVLSHLRANAAI